MFMIEKRARILGNTSSIKCCNFTSKMSWTGWIIFEHFVSEDEVKRRLKYWRRLNLKAVDMYGEAARSEYRAVKTLKT